MLEHSRLLRPVLFLCIKGEGLNYYRYWLPFWSTTIVICYFVIYPREIILFGDRSIISTLSSLLQLLPGFYIAALAAISTFNRKLMDKKLSGATVTLISCENGNLEQRELSRRHFLSLLFGYLSFLSMMILVFSCITQMASPMEIIDMYLKTIDAKQYSKLIEWGFFVPIIFFFFQMIMITFLGLFYLCDRMHWKGDEQIVK